MFPHRFLYFLTWIACCLLISSLIGVYLVFANDTLNVNQPTDKPVIQQKTIKNKTKSKDATENNVLVEVTDAMEEEEEESYAYTPSIAPATPHVLLTSLAISFSEASTSSYLPPQSIHFDVRATPSQSDASTSVAISSNGCTSSIVTSAYTSGVPEGAPGTSLHNAAAAQATTPVLNDASIPPLSDNTPVIHDKDTVIEIEGNEYYYATEVDESYFEKKEKEADLPIAKNDKSDLSNDAIKNAKIKYRVPVTTEEKHMKHEVVDDALKIKQTHLDLESSTQEQASRTNIVLDKEEVKTSVREEKTDDKHTEFIIQEKHQGGLEKNSLHVQNDRQPFPSPTPHGPTSNIVVLEDASSPLDSKEPEAKEEGMLSFTEWKKKLDKVKEIEEDTIDVSKLVTHRNKTSGKKKNKIKKNYASIECGAKVVSANDEASNSIAILKEDKDTYMLNPCNVKAWFVVELCERIEVDSFDFANFEMFSSTPESFDVYVSSRYPTREWEKVHTCHAKPEKEIQTFAFEERFYAKYIKIEIKKYFGKEHYCPLSLLRVFGITEVEQIEAEEEQESSAEESSSNDGTSNIEPESENLETNSDNIITTAKKALVGLVSNMLSSQPSTEKNDSFESQSKHIELVTLLPEDDPNGRHDGTDFLTKCLQRTTLANLNISLNLACGIWFQYGLQKQMCPSTNIAFANFPNHHSNYHPKIYRKLRAKRKTSPTQEPLTLQVEKTESSSEMSSIVTVEDSESVPPLAMPPLASTESIKTNVLSIENSSVSATQSPVGTSSINSSEGVQQDIAVTHEHKTAKSMCSKETFSVDVRKLIEPTIQPSYSVDTTTATLATKSLQSTENKINSTVNNAVKGRVDSGIKPSSVLESTSELKQESVDVLEFKINETNNNGVVAEKSEIHDMTTSILVEKDTIEPSISESSAEVKSTEESEDQDTVQSSNISEKIETVPESSNFKTDGTEAAHAPPESKASSDKSSTNSEQTPPVTLSLLVNTVSPVTSEIHPSPTKSTSTIDIPPESIDGDSATAMPAQESKAKTTILESTSEKVSTQQPNTATLLKSSTGISGSKESIIVKLNAKVKALQANLTMSMMYLEEMSERYRAAVEEVDQRHEKKSFSLNVSIKNHEDMINHHSAVIASLTKQVEELTKKLHNLTILTKEQHDKLSETHFTWMFLEIVLVLMVLILCQRPARQQPVEDIRRSYSEPVIKFRETNGTLKRSVKPHKSDSDVVLNEPYDPYQVSIVNCPSKRKKRKKSHRSLDRETIEQVREATVSKTAGLLFYAGRGLISGITGAFYRGREADDKPSRQAVALLDDIPESAHEKTKFLSRAKSTELPTIEEVDASCIIPERAKSCTELVMGFSNTHKKHRSKVHKSVGRFS